MGEQNQTATRQQAQTCSEEKASSRLDSLEISTWHNGYEWAACLGEYDLGVHVSTGRTQREAVNELLDSIEQDNGELHS